MPHGQMDARMQECIELCSECHKVCVETAAHCLEMGGRHAEASHIRLLLDCAQICETSEDFMLRGSEAHGRVCTVCAEICQRCAEDCERFDDDFMKRCAEVCRACAEACRRMAGAMAAA